MRFSLAALGLAAALVTAAPAFAHGDVELTGKVLSVSATAIKVQTPAGKTVEVSTDKQTRYLVNGKAVKAQDLKAGQNVHIAGVGDSADDMVAMDITVEAGPARTR